ncbi:MAG: oligosaccharide flippase family protein [FCB group bacterium]|nr:oligosaccharide flippase family protein [FCB group bacterium]
MFSPLKQFFKESMIYSFGHILIRFVSFMLVPIYTNSFSQQDYGTLSLVFTFIGFAQIFYNYGMASSLMKFYAGESENKARVVTTTFITLGITSFFFSALVWVFAAPLTTILFGDSNPIWLHYIAGILFLDAISVRAMILLRFDNRALKFMLFALVNVIVTMAANIKLVAYQGLGVTGAIEATFIAAVVSFLLILPTLLKNINFSYYSRELLMRMLSFGIPFIPAAFFQVVMDLSDRYLVDWMGGRDMVGIYSAGYKLGSLMLIVVTGFNMGWQPFFLSKENDPKAPELFAQIASYIAIVLTGIWVFFILFVEGLVRLNLFGFTIIGERFWESTSIIPVIMLGYIFLGFYDLLMPGIFFKNMSRTLPRYRAIGAVSNIGLNLLFIPRWGIMGAAWATCISFALMGITLYFHTQQLFRIPFNWKFILPQFGLGCVIYLLKLVFEPSFQLSAILFAGYFVVICFSAIRLKKAGEVT